jgi:hypothetical protein
MNLASFFAELKRRSVCKAENRPVQLTDFKDLEFTFLDRARTSVRHNIADWPELFRKTLWIKC